MPISFSRTKLAFLLALPAMVVTAAGCAPVYVEQEAPELPELSDTQAMYQRLVRNEMSALDSIDLVGDECAGCLDFAPTFTEHSTQRAELLGGLWDPWEGDIPSGAPEPESIPTAAKTWPELATKLLQTGMADLSASTTLADESQRLAAAAVASGRIADGFRLAHLTGVQEDLGALGDIKVDDATLTPQQKNALALAVAQWDCAAQFIPSYTASDDHNEPSALEQLGRAQVDQLLDLSATTLAAGVADQRVPYCTSAFTAEDEVSLSSIEDELATTNLALFVRHFDMNLAAPATSLPLPYDALISQLRIWGQIGDVPAVPGVKISDIAPSEPDETSATLYAPFYNPDPKPAVPGETEFQLFYNDESVSDGPQTTSDADE